eukprot:s2117_g4.t1
MLKMSQGIAQMDVINPEIMRVTRAFQTFQRFGAVLRVECDGDFYHKSCPSNKISTFWSHSWHGGHWKKILTLITLYNGSAAVCLGLLTGLVMMLLFSFGQLPGFDRGFYIESVRWSTWSVCSGFLVTCLVFALWRPQTQVFLDRVCISQTDNDLKAQAIFSLAGLLKNSNQMLILWDPTWTERLWCLFELAAFLKSKKVERKQVLIVRPVFLGPMSIVFFLTISAAVMPITTVPVETVTAGFIPAAVVLLLSMVVGYAAVSILRNYFRDLDIMKQQLLSISFDSTRSACCDRNHRSPAGEPLICDRKIVKECVNIWFGSQQAFEDTVRSEFLESLNHDLVEQVLSPSWILGITAPIMLAFMDLAASFAFLQDWPFLLHPTPALLLEGLVIWLLGSFTMKDLLLLSCRITRKRPAKNFLEPVKNAFALLLFAIPVMLLLLCYSWTRFVPFSGLQTAMHRALEFTGGMVVLSGCNYLVAMALKALLRRPGWCPSALEACSVPSVSQRGPTVSEPVALLTLQGEYLLLATSPFLQLVPPKLCVPPCRVWGSSGVVRFVVSPAATRPVGPLQD